MNPRFYFATCQVGAEKAVKAEIISEFPHLRFAFSRPGFITFKEDDDRKPAIRETHGVFVRLWGLSIGQAKDLESFINLVEGIPSGSKVHLFERDQFLPGDEPQNFKANAKITAAVEDIKKSHPEIAKQNLKWNEPPKVGEAVCDLIWIDESHVFLGGHTHTALLDPSPGNKPDLQLPEDAPSRAYLKIVEAIHRFKPTLKAGMQVLEVGCSPGGATTALLARGLRVTGIDPKAMDRSLYSNQNFSFIQKPAMEVSASELLRVNPDWIVMDMNIAPLEAIDELGYILDCLKKNFKSDLKLKHGFLTIKLNDWKFSESIPLYLKRLREKGFQDMIATQLCSNRQEFFVMARKFGRV